MKIFLWMLNAQYRNKEIFGDDADTFNPNRWLSETIESKNDVPLGVIGNLWAFLSSLTMIKCKVVFLG
jgi:hypothetical protein